MDEYIEEGANASVVKLKIVDPMPPDIPLIIGDAAHNLRTALDHLMIGIVTAVRGKASKYLAFPVDESRDQALKNPTYGNKKDLSRRIPLHL
jgi:hypothetical protein